MTVTSEYWPLASHQSWGEGGKGEGLLPIIGSSGSLNEWTG